MRRILKTVPFTVAVVLVLAVGAASASAALPEYKTSGGFPFNFTFQNESGVEPTIASYVPTLGSERNIICKASKGTGEIAKFGGEVYKKLVFTYTGCREQGVTPEEKCTTGKNSAGEIVTSKLDGTIGYVEGRSGKEVGLELKPESGSKLAEFECNGEAETVEVRGCTIGEATPLNVSQTTSNVIFAEGPSHDQKWTKLEGKSGSCELTVKAGFIGFGKATSWLMDNELESFSETVELKA